MQELNFIYSSKKDLLENFWSYIRQIVEQNSNKPYIISKKGMLTYRQHNHYANVIAEKLSPHFDQKRFGVGFFMKDPLWIIPAMYGVLKAGLYFVPLDVSFPANTLHQMFDISDIRYILTDNTHIVEAESILKPGMTLINLEDLDYSKDVPEPNIPYSPDDIVQIMFTSGSTGTPKGAVEDYRYLVRSIAVKLDRGVYEPSDKSLQISTFTYSAPHSHTFAMLIAGGTLYYHNIKDEGLLAVPEIIRQEEITAFSATPTVFRSLVSILGSSESFPSIKKMTLGGEKKLPEDIKAVRRLFPNVKSISLGFASTETQMVSTYEFPIDFEDNPIPSGIPYRDIRLFIWDEEGNPLPEGQEGEIVVYGDALVRGYINNPELTKAQFIPDPGNPLGQYFKTGDLGKILPDGQLLHLGRIDSMVKIKGVRIELDTLENHILGYPGIIQVASRAIDDQHGGKKLVSYFVAADGLEVPVSDLRKFLAERLPPQHLPHFLIQLEQIPMTRNGKVAITKLPMPRMVRPELPYPFEPPADALEESLLEIWEEQLGVTGIGVNDDFFDVGGDSLLGVVLVVAIEEKLGTELPVSVLLQAPTIRNQADMIRNNRTDQAFSPIIPIRTEGSLPPLFFVPGKGGYPTRIRHLSKTLDTEIPVYAMQDLLGESKAANGVKQIKSTAALFLSEIRRIAPHGPYVLVGESLGGKVCYEIAQQLLAQGEPEPLVFMLDTYNFEYSVKDEYQEERNLSYYKMLVGKHLSIWLKSDWEGKKEYLRFYKDTIGDKLKRFMKNRARDYKKTQKPEAGSTLPENVKQLEREFKEAALSYETEPYPGKVMLIKALRGPYAFDRANGWDRVDIGKLVVHQLDCYHGSILFEPAVTELAEIIQKYVRDYFKGNAVIAFENISKRYAKDTSREVSALDHITFTIKENEFVSLVGPSGCGKTTFLKIVANLIQSDSGKIRYEGFENPSAILVFQDQGVLPWMTVLENVGLGLELKGIPKKQRQKQVLDFMEVVRLEGFEKYYPHELSGGMRQRVALARAFLTNPDLLLMDEPFGALDAQTRIVLQEELLDIWREHPKTVLFVTHDIDEAILLSDRVIVMSDRPGKIQASIDIPIARPRDLTQKDDPRFMEIRWKIWNLLEKEVREDIKIIQEKFHA
jgi:amino acid adenylation domain-containing protein